ncbi:hypothetical protein HK405_004017, partial [Cladochytrium tenue]
MPVMWVDEDENNFFTETFFTLYFDMAMLLLYNRVVLFRFSSDLFDLAELTHAQPYGIASKSPRKDLERTSSRFLSGRNVTAVQIASAAVGIHHTPPWHPKKLAERGFLHAREQFSRFVDLYLFPLVSNQQQGVEMYSIFRMAMDIDALYTEIKAQVSDSHDFYNSKVGREQNNVLFMLTIITFLSIPVSAMLGLLGASEWLSWTKRRLGYVDSDSDSGSDSDSTADLNSGLRTGTVDDWFLQLVGSALLWGVLSISLLASLALLGNFVVAGMVARSGDETVLVGKARTRFAVPFPYWLQQQQQNQARHTDVHREETAARADVDWIWTEATAADPYWRPVLDGSLDPQAPGNDNDAAFQRRNYFSPEVTAAYNDRARTFSLRASSSGHLRLPPMRLSWSPEGSRSGSSRNLDMEVVGAYLVLFEFPTVDIKNHIPGPLHHGFIVVDLNFPSSVQLQNTSSNSERADSLSLADVLQVNELFKYYRLPFIDHPTFGYADLLKGCRYDWRSESVHLTDDSGGSDSGPWVRLVNVDLPSVSKPGIPTPFERSWVDPLTYRRWSHFGSQYGFTYHSGAFWTDPTSDAFFDIFFGVYFDLALGLLYSRVVLLRFSLDLALLAPPAGAGHLLYRGNPPFSAARLGPSSAIRPHALQTDRLLSFRQNLQTFIAVFLSPSLSIQQQGHELSGLFRTAMEIDHLYDHLLKRVEVERVIMLDSKERRDSRKG